MQSVRCHAARYPCLCSPHRARRLCCTLRADHVADPSCTSTDTVNEACGLTDLSTPNADMTCTATCARAYVPFYVKCAATFSEMGLRSSLDAFYQSCLAVEQPATPTASCKNTFPNADCLRLKGQFDSKGIHAPPHAVTETSVACVPKLPPSLPRRVLLLHDRRGQGHQQSSVRPPPVTRCATTPARSG